MFDPITVLRSGAIGLGGVFETPWAEHTALCNEVVRFGKLPNQARAR
jgi:hypothetical protein